MTSKKEQLVRLVGEDSVFNKPDILNAYSQDKSLGPQIKPNFVVKPAVHTRTLTPTHKIMLTKAKTPLVAKGEKRYKKVTITKQHHRSRSIVRVIPRHSRHKANGSVPVGGIRFSPRPVGTPYGGFSREAAI